jgi:hypothetical protein
VADNEAMQSKKQAIMQYVQEHSDLQINVEQSRIFGPRLNPCSIASSGITFCPPDNAIKVALTLPFDLDEKCGNWHIAYHATKCINAFNIAKNGFNLDPSLERQGKAYGNGVYLTPSWNLATQWTCDDVNTNDGSIFGTVLQCRIRPYSLGERKTFTINPCTWAITDEECLSQGIPVKDKLALPLEIDSSVCELVVADPNDVVVYGILFKENPHKEWNLIHMNK